MKEFRLRCSYCDGYGYVETPDPELVQKCRVCNGSGIDADTHERMLGVLLRRTYTDYADRDPIWRMPSARTLKLLEDGVPLSSKQYEWHEISRDPSSHKVVCTCPVFRYSLRGECKHTLFPIWLSTFRTHGDCFEVPAWTRSTGYTGLLRVYFEADLHAPLWHYRVYLDRRTYLSGSMPDWLYRMAHRVGLSRDILRCLLSKHFMAEV